MPRVKGELVNATHFGGQNSPFWAIANRKPIHASSSKRPEPCITEKGNYGHGCLFETRKGRHDAQRIESRDAPRAVGAPRRDRSGGACGKKPCHGPPCGRCRSVA